MLTYSIHTSYFMLMLGTLFGLYRLLKGPNTLNRILAFDYLSTCIISLIALFSIERKTVDFLEVILIFSLLGFATIISFMEIYFAKRGENE